MPMLSLYIQSAPTFSQRQRDNVLEICQHINISLFNKTINEMGCLIQIFRGSCYYYSKEYKKRNCSLRVWKFMKASL